MDTDEETAKRKKKEETLNKFRAIGKMSRFYKTLSEEKTAVVKLKARETDSFFRRFLNFFLVIHPKKPIILVSANLRGAIKNWAPFLFPHLTTASTLWCNLGFYINIYEKQICLSGADVRLSRGGGGGWRGGII